MQFLLNSKDLINLEVTLPLVIQMSHCRTVAFKYRTVSYRTIRYRTVLYRYYIVPYYDVPCGTVPYGTVPYCLIRHRYGIRNTYAFPLGIQLTSRLAHQEAAMACQSGNSI